MSRTLTAGVQTEIENLSLRPFYLVRFLFSTPVYYTTCYKTIVHDGDTYLANGFLLSVPTINENWQIENPSYNIQTTGADQTLLSVALSENYSNATVEVFLGFLDENEDVVADPVSIFLGLVDNVNLREEPGGTSVLTWGLVSYWADFEQVHGRRTNQRTQEAYVITDPEGQGYNVSTDMDYGFEFAGEPLVNKMWGNRITEGM